MKNNLRTFTLLSVTFFSLLILSSLTFYYREQAYVRPESYFYLLSLAVAIVFAQALLLRNSSRWVKLTLFAEVLFIPLSFVLTQQTLYKTVLGRDPWAHWIFVEEIARRGYIPLYNEVPIPYVKMPNFHLLIVSGIVLTDLKYKWADLLFAGMPTLILLMLVAYLYSKKLFGGKVALASILLVAISDNVLDIAGKSIIPNSVGVALAFLIFYLVYFRSLNDSKIKFLAVLLSISLVLMHTVSFSLLIWQVVVVSILALVFKEKEAKEYLTFLGFLIVLAFFEWALYSGFYLKGLTAIFKQLFIHGFDVERYEARLPVSFLDVLMARLGMLLYFAIAGISLLRMFILLFKNKFRDKLMLSNVVSTGGIVAGVATFLNPTLSQISHRFWYYGEVLSSAFVGSLLDYFGKDSNWRKILSIIFIALLGVLMLRANVANDDNPLVPQYSIRTGWYDSEISTAKFVTTHSSLPVATDIDFQHFSSVIVGMLNEDHRSFPTCNLQTFDAIIQNRDCLALIRVKLIQDRYFVLGKGYSQRAYLSLGAETKEVLSRIFVFKNAIYNTGSVIAVV
ncbi:hypothetical protein [Thermococcus sibiricus]|uniref:Glycosyltransferase RgtA/B/C/D-like domain-containing protein n=1 Tax=Thermococcus sibiricus (strain DSM 12597 / MM 739) TaxID=604354 RepID=C6A0C6_THESM|nr:hypothetical protein [Thermococcus sibiricus]ACS91107.1 hypothetical protein TSIB_2060 [Thermococcus sibiricus MM 739]